MKIMRHIVILLIIFPYFNFAQKCGLVADNQTKFGIPYATISVINKPFGIISDERGGFCFEAKTSNMDNDSIVISALGYEHRKISFKQYLKSDTIFLREKNVVLGEVVVKSKKSKAINLGNFHKRWLVHQTTISPNSSQILALKIENKHSTGIIEALHFRLDPQKSDFVKKFRLRCRIFKNGDEDTPTEDILEDNVIVDVTPDEKYIDVDISSYNIPFDYQYLWVGIQSIGYIDKEDNYISISEYQYGKATYKKNNPKKVSSIMLISPSFQMNDQGIGKSKKVWNKYWNPISTPKNNSPLFGLTLIN
ncbi:carboxypeptidase-like protein [Arcicella aurantiaca]|uniref:Carboxypeptidase-like protein n=1 Tax=Arcicella aurantiaca TaxID=591202 RepID=A0A316DD35_9BACT|nr:carboxypeptidase-like regulatory domain-containing protein [Arcicella aurantiaca]PWK16137.1 carboxypeptidase-like protein [Arcicella aurantiaca]